jgi:hypothetical protein
MKMLSRTLMAVLFFQLAPACAQAQNSLVPAGLRQEFDSFLAKFREALKANDAVAVAGMTRLPFMGDPASGDTVKFSSKIYPGLFSTKVRRCLARSKPAYDRDQQGNDNFHIVCGEEIFYFTKSPQGFLFAEVGMND